MKLFRSIFIYSLTESQNHRMFGVRRDLCGSSTPSPLLKQGHLKEAAQDLVQAGIESLLSSRSALSLYLSTGLFLPRCRTLHWPLWNFIRFLCSQLSSLSGSHWMAAQPSSVSTTPPSFVSSANLLRVHSNSSSRSLIKNLNKIGPNTDPWGTPLVTGLQLDSAPLMTTLWALPCHLYHNIYHNGLLLQEQVVSNT